MKKLLAAFLLLGSCSASAQTLFYYGKDSVSAQEFLTAYNRNNTGEKTEKAILEYLDLYINSRLKIAEARNRGYDTLPQLVADLENLRQQIMPSYLIDKQTVNKLVAEAYNRSQKDIHLAHIFINAIDSIEAKKRLANLQADLKKGMAFSKAAQTYSDDPSAKTNGGDLGYVTVFTLPYAIENIVYATPVGKISSPYRSRSGYHIFKNIGERKAIGTIKAAQILVALPPEADEATKATAKKLADSLYNRLVKGDDFGKLASRFSNDVVSAATNGVMQEFGTGQYDPVFEKNVFALPKDGAISQPFLTSHGYHIVKRISKTPVAGVKTRALMVSLREKTEQSDRMQSLQSALAKKILTKTNYHPAPFQPVELWAFSDSVLNKKPPKTAIHLTSASPLFSFAGKAVTVQDWINYSQTNRFKADGSGLKSYSQLWDEFIESSALEYYQAHLEDFNPDFRQQLNEFREGNLFFEIMQQQVWSPAQNDSTGLQQYFEEHKNNYHWKGSADAVLFYASDLETARSFTTELKKAPSNWQQLVSEMSEKIAADSSRFELSQLPNPTHLPFNAGTITSPVVNPADNSASFAYIIKPYTGTSPRSFAEAKGLVITDYQNEIEKKWVAELKKKYPVRVNQKLVNELKKQKK